MDQSESIKVQAERAVIYVRVSTDEQVDNYSLGTQEDICKKEAERRGYTVTQVFREEGRSAKTIKGRPILVEMLTYCKKHKRNIDAIIVYRLDRISRQTSDYLAIRKKLLESEIKLISASEPTGNSPTEKFVETMLAGFAQMDNDVRSERTKNGMRARFMAGLNNGTVPLGYLNKNGYAIKDPETFEKIKTAWELMATGTVTLREIAKILERQGVKQGKRDGLRHQSANRLFRNKFYTGKVMSPKYGLERRGQHSAMITEEVYYQVQAVLDGRNTNKAAPIIRKNRDNPDFPLRRIVKCKCGCSFTGAWSKGKRERFAYYFCPKRCDAGKSVPVEVVNEKTKKLLREVTLYPSTTNLICDFMRNKYYQRSGGLQKRIESADDELRKQYELRQALIEKNLAGVYPDDMFKEQNKLVEARIKDIQITKNDELLEKYDLESISKFVKDKFENLVQTFEKSDLNEIRTLMCSIFPSGVVWSSNGFSNTKKSPFYQAFLDIQNGVGNFGDPERTRTADLHSDSVAF